MTERDGGDHVTDHKWTVCCDFDGVIHSYTSGWQEDWLVDPIGKLDPPVEGAIEWLNEIHKHFDLVIHTTRGKYGAAGRLAIMGWLWHYGYTGPLPHITSNKVPALIYIDDRAWRFEGPGTLPTKEQVHQAIPWNKKEPNGK